METILMKRLKKLEIGAVVDLSYQDSTEKKWVTGVITDSDFLSGLEILVAQEYLILDYALICGLKVQRTIQHSLRDLEVNTSIRYALDEVHELDQAGIVVWNNHENSIGLKSGAGPIKTIAYTQFTGIAVCGGSSKQLQEVSAKYCRDPEEMLKAGDPVIQKTYTALPQNEQKKLSSVNQRFVYGVRNNDTQKMEVAANQARQIIFQEDDQGYRWSENAVLYAAYLLRRVGIVDCDVLLAGEVLPEAAYAAWHEGQFPRAGAYAVAALLEEDPRETENLFRILGSSILKSGDGSGLRVLRRYLPENLTLPLQELMAELLAARGSQWNGDPDGGMAQIEQFFHGTEMERIATGWLPPCLTEAPESTDLEEPVESDKQGIGMVSKLNWSEGTAVIDCTDGQKYTFTYNEIDDQKMKKYLSNCMRTDLGGKMFFVTFDREKNGMACNVRSFTDYVDKARTMTTTRDEMRFELGYEMCKQALETGDRARAITDLLRYAIALGSGKQKLDYVKEALALYQQNTDVFPDTPFALMDVVRCWGCLEDHARELEYAEKVMDYTGLQAKQKLALLSNYLKLVKECYDEKADPALLMRMQSRIDQAGQECAKEISTDPNLETLYKKTTIGYRVMIACGQDKLQEAEDLFSVMPSNHIMYSYARTTMERARARLAEAASVCQPCDNAGAERQDGGQDPVVPEVSIGHSEKDPCQEEAPVQIKPYSDAQGWDDLGLSKEEAVDYALRIGGEDRLAAQLVWLHAAAELNDQLLPVCRTIALAANDPMESPDYSPEAVVDALAEVDGSYPELNALCMDAACLRASFLCDRTYSVQMLRSSFDAERQMDSLRDVCDTLEEFRQEVGCSIDHYADYRSHDIRKQCEERGKTVRYAEELYVKFVQNPPRDGARFFRLLKTKQIVFAKDGYLAVMLRRIMEQDTPALDHARDHFTASFLKGSGQLADMTVNRDSIEEIINSAWQLAGRNLTTEKSNATLQGDRRNNIRSNISEVLRCITRWYVFEEQETGTALRTEAGERAYQRLQPKLLDQLAQLEADCNQETGNPQTDTGMYLLGRTARELRGRLDGSWSQEHRGWMYANLLRGSGILLKEDGMPDLSATFCGLTDFNILARIRKYVEQPKRTWQEQLDLIFGPDAACGNYGTARQIVEYLAFAGLSDAVSFPEHPERYVEYAKMQADLRFSRFLETYGLARINSQISTRNAFWDTVEDTLRYWYQICKENGNYGFFISLLTAYERRLDEEARQFGEYHMQQLEELIRNEPAWFAEHPGHADAIRRMIAEHHFAVARDWMRRIPGCGFPLEVPKPEAMVWLEEYFSEDYIDAYQKTADTSRSLNSLLALSEVGAPTDEQAQQLISAWIDTGHPADTDRMGRLLGLLGWNHVRVTRVSHPHDRELELYQVTADEAFTAAHPIAEFGSMLRHESMYVACLYGVSDCDRICREAAILDQLDGGKVILLDCALSQSERRTLANHLKQRRNGLRHTTMFIDRVLIAHLAAHYDADNIGRMLTACAMPFSFCAFGGDSDAQHLAPELFAGRQEELHQITDPEGANLLVGGAQLGKSALLHKAASELDGHDGRRAAVVDVAGLDCTAAAQKVSRELVHLGILDEAEATGDWQCLCDTLRGFLICEDHFDSLLLMLDDADTMIDTRDAYGVCPMNELLELQRAVTGRFKAVLAGKDSLVSFARQAAEADRPIGAVILRPMDGVEARELLTEQLSYLGVMFPNQAALSQALVQCGGLPGLIRMYAVKLADTLRDPDYAGYDLKNTPPYVVTEDHLRRIAGDMAFQEQLREQFTAVLTANRKGSSGQLMLLFGWLQHAAPSAEGYTARQVQYYIGELSLNGLLELEEQQLGALLEDLRDLNVLRSTMPGRYLLAGDRYAELLGTEEAIFGKLMNDGGTET